MRNHQDIAMLVKGVSDSLTAAHSACNIAAVCGEDLTEDSIAEAIVHDLEEIEAEVCQLMIRANRLHDRIQNGEI
ncbi:MAG TPA: hypothetical protein VH593_11340 [Ktedonobacteraceae bacterium]|jgi:hypothetical protein